MRLTPILEEHAYAWAEWRSGATARRFMPLDDVSIADLTDRIRSCSGTVGDRAAKEYRWIVELRGKPVGTVAAVRPSWRMGYSEISYLLAEEYQGKGIGTQAVTMLVGEIFAAREFSRVFALTSSDNIVSIRLLTTLRFTHEGTLRKHFLIQGRHVDQLVFGLLRSEWEV